MGVNGAWSSQVIVASQVIIQGADDFLLVYNGVPGPGTLALAIAPSAGSDAYGNEYLDSLTSIASGQWAELFDGNLFLGPGTPTAANRVMAGSVSFTGTTGQLEVRSGQNSTDTNQASGLWTPGTSAAGGGPQIQFSDSASAVDLIMKLIGHLIVGGLETGQAQLVVNGPSGLSADLLDLEVNSVKQLAVDQLGNITTLGKISPLVTASAVDTNSSTTTSTTYAASSRALSATAVLPASARASVRFMVRQSSSVAGDNVLSDVQITGSTSGTIHAANDAGAIQFSETTSAGPFYTEYPITGAAGETVTVTAQHRVTAGTGTFQFRKIVIQTLPA